VVNLASVLLLERAT